VTNDRNHIERRYMLGNAHRCVGALAVGAGLATLLFVGTARASDDAGQNGLMNAEEYRLYREYQAALRDPRVESMAEGRRVQAIARNFGVPVPRLREVIAKGDAHAEAQVADQQRAAHAALEQGPVKGRVTSVELVDNRGIVVAYVGWRATDNDRLPYEAAHLAKAVSDAAPVADLVAVWACMGRRKVFTARIQTSAAARINASRIEDFAETRYIRLFEEVRNRFAGEPPEDDTGCDR
jgi:hypothetical protein